MRVDSKLLVAAVCALLGCGGLGCSGADVSSEQASVPSETKLNTQSLNTQSLNTQSLTADDDVNANSDDGEVVAFRVRLDPKPCVAGAGLCGGLYLQAAGSSEEIYVEGASFAEQNLGGLARELFLYLARGGRGVVIGTLCRGQLDRTPPTESGVVIGTLKGVVIGTRRAVVDGHGNFIGTFTKDANGADQTLRIRAIVSDAE